MKKILALFLAAALVLGLSAASSARGRKFGASLMDMSSPYFVVLNDTIRAVVEDNGDTLLMLDPERKQENQNAQIREMIAQGVDAIFLTPVDWKEVADALRVCKEAGIPVINVDAPVYDEDLVACVICSDNLEAGRLCGEDLLKQLWGGKIAILTDPITKTGLDRISKFEEIVTATPGFLVAVKRDCGGREDRAYAVMREIIQKMRDIDAVMCTSDTVATGAIAALREAGKLADILVYGVNGSPEGKKAILAGEMAGTSAQSPIGMGHIACEMAYRVLAGKKVEKHVTVPVLFINKSNLSRFFLDGWQ